MTILIVIALEILVPSLVHVFFGAAFEAVIPVTRVLLVASMFLSARRILAEVMKGAGDPAAGSIAELVSVASLILAIVLLTPSLHLVGVGVAVGISAAVGLALLYVLDLKRGGRPPSRLGFLDVESAAGKARL
jgi:O-antigen/teichoic acid export membrane protein